MWLFYIKNRCNRQYFISYLHQIIQVHFTVFLYLSVSSTTLCIIKGRAVAYHTELSMKIASLGLAALHSKELGIVFMLTIVECHHMKRLSKDSRLYEC